MSRAEGLKKAQAVQDRKLEGFRNDALWREGTMALGRFSIRVRVTDVTYAYGRLRYVVESIDRGVRQAVWAERVTLDPEPTEEETPSVAEQPNVSEPLEELDLFEF